MMNSKFYLLALALGTLAACSNDNEMDNATSNSDLVPLEVTGSINGVKTRVTADSKWEVQDHIGITGTSGSLTYTNVEYAYNEANSTFEPLSSKPPIYFGAPTGKFKAYYPHEKTGDIITRDVTEQRMYTLDFLYANEVEVKKDEPSLDFKFDHKMSMLILHMSAGKGFNSDNFGGLQSKFKIDLTPVHSQAAFNTEDGTVTPQGETSVSFQPVAYTEYIPYQNGTGNYKSYYYRIILCPENIEGGITLSYIKDNVPYTTKLTTDKDETLMNMEPGKVYEYTVTVSKTGMEANDVTINDWTPAWDGSHKVEATV